MAVDAIGGKRAMLLSSVGCSCANFALGAIAYLEWWHGTTLEIAMAGLFSINMALQGFGTAAAVKLNATWYTKAETGVFSGIFNVCITTGYFLALAVSGWVLEFMHWSFVFFLPAALLLLVSLPLSQLEEAPSQEIFVGVTDLEPIPEDLGEYKRGVTAESRIATT